MVSKFKKRQKPLVVAMTDGATITPNVDQGDVFTVTLAGNRNLANPTGTPTNGQKMMIRFRQDGTGNRTITHTGSQYRFGTDITGVTLTTTAAKTDYVGYVYHSADSKWDVIAFVKGY